MKIVICGGDNQSSYIIDMFKKDKKRSNKLIVINSDQEIAQKLSNKFKIPVLVGDYTKTYTLDDAQIVNSDLFITLGHSDSDNYVACLLAKNVYHCKKVICALTNPSNVSIFKKLGIDSAISSAFLIGETIRNESNIEDVFKTLSIEDDMIKIIEVDIKSSYDICDKELKDIDFPEYGTISAIFRKPHIIIPKGKTDIRKDDKLIMVASTKDEEDLIAYVTRAKKTPKKE
jgi:trk system potassium uptake protein TrkA